MLKDRDKTKRRKHQVINDKLGCDISVSKVFEFQSNKAPINVAVYASPALLQCPVVLGQLLLCVVTKYPTERECFKIRFSSSRLYTLSLPIFNFNMGFGHIESKETKTLDQILVGVGVTCS